jgi:hypothetical protein
VNRRWPAFAASVGFALAVTCWVGWQRYAAQEPPASAVHTAAAPVEFAGSRFTVGRLQRLASVVADGKVVEPLRGAVWVRLDLRQDVLAPEPPSCSGWLFAGPDRWEDGESPLPEPGLSSCGRVDGVGLAPGQGKDLSFFWEVPERVASGPMAFELRFGEAGTLSVRP